MKRLFIQRNFAPESLIIIERTNEILADYEEQGFDLTLRQLYYQFISKDLFPESWIDTAYNLKNGLPPDTKNTERNYKNLGSLVSDGRLAGMIDWDMIKDRGREMVKNSHWDSPASILDSCVESFQVNKWSNQRNHVEVMVEKQALEGILIPVCEKMDVNFTANKGYSSSSAMYEAGRRLYAAMREEKMPFVIYLGDHDPSGVDMSRDILDRLRLFSNYTEGDTQCVRVHRIALNMDQIRKFKPPENPAKVTDSRAKSYIEKFGESSWELDAIEPRTLAKLVQDQIIALRDDDKWAEALAREDSMKAELTALAENQRKKWK